MNSMNSIGDFFGKFRNLAIFELKKREKISEAIEIATKQKIGVGDISIKDGVIIIKGGASLKSEIYMKKTKILELLALKLSDLKIRDIK